MKERLQRLSHFRISAMLYVAFGGTVALTLGAALVGWFSFNRVDAAQSQVNEVNLPEVAAAFGVAEYSSALVAAAPRLTAAENLVDMNTVYGNITTTNEALNEQLLILEEIAQDDERSAAIREHAQTLTANIEAIRDQRYRLFQLDSRRETLQRELGNLRSRTLNIIVPAIDDQLFYTVTGYQKLNESPAPPAEHFSEAEFNRYRFLYELQGDANIATELLANAFTLTEPAAIEPLRERFEAAAGRIDRNLAELEGSPVHRRIEPVFTRISGLGLGDQNGFDVLEQQLRLIQGQRTLLEHNRSVAVALVAEVDGLVVDSQSSAQSAALASAQSILTGRTLLLVITGISVGAAVLIAWLLVGRMILRRIGMVSEWMRRLAGGDLETVVEVGGNDEITDMAAAVDVFRRHALEIQRLNLVEMLAGDLQEKNEELETTLSDLHRAQDQIVAQGKLSALGELTAGVAHEIRNPLNFVKNFSEASGELLTELQEVLEEVGDSLTEEQRGLIQDISGDLTDNLERIRNHGERANSIVHSMLMMSRGTGEFQLMDVNALLDEHARLAFHSARATDPDFQLDLALDNLDPTVGELEVIPQDLGRVFVNMVSNACYATNEKRTAALAAGESYFPKLTIVTQRDEENITISIKDNGSGMPPEVAEKIFNPFFTTKPTDQGTGLGLAISNDIVRQHGGVIRVNTEPGEFTEMLIELPLERPEIPEEDPDSGAEPAIPAETAAALD